jgi:hypothetical protein
MADVIRCTCSSCGFVKYCDDSGTPVDATTILQESSGECPRCRERGAVVTIEAQLPGRPTPGEAEIS